MDIQADYTDTPERRLLDLRRDGLADVPLLGRGAYLHARPDLPVHRHFGVVEIVYIERGGQYFLVGHDLYRVRGGELFVTFPDEPHSTGGYPMEPNLFYWLNLRLPKTGQSLLGMPSKESGEFVRGLCDLPRRHFRGSGAIKALFNHLLQLHDRPEMGLRTIRMRQTLLELLLEVIDSAARHANSATSRRMTEIIAMIEGQPEGDFRLEELAERAGLSLSRFKTRFKAETGTPPRQFILRRKIENARKRLANGREPILQIAMGLGFPTSQYFATVFKRITGSTPQEYRSSAAASPRESHRRSDGQG